MLLAVVDFFAAGFFAAGFLAGAFFAVVFFFAGPLARFSARSSKARAGVMPSTESSLRRVAFVSPSVT